MSLSHEERELRRIAIADYIKEGNSSTDAMETFGVSDMTVSRACKEDGVHPRCGKFSMRSNYTFKVLFLLMNTKATIQSLADKFRVSRQRIFHIKNAAIDAGFKIPARPRGPYKKRRQSQSTK